MLPAMARRSGIGCGLPSLRYGSSPRNAAPSSGGRPMPISASPVCTRTGFWVPPPGTTLILSPAFSRMSSAMPPEMVYQPPPTAPAVHVSDCWALAGKADAARSASAPRAESVFMSIGMSLLSNVLAIDYGAAGSCGPGRQPVSHGVVHHPDQGGDVEDGPPGGELDIRAIGRHIGALEHDRADLRVLRDEPPRHREVLLARGLDIQLEQIVEHHPGELLLRLEPRHHGGDL